MAGVSKPTATLATACSASEAERGRRSPSLARCASRRLIGPQYMLSPSESKIKSSKRSKTAAEGWWMTQSTVRPSVARVFSVLTTRSAAKESKPLVGSSANTTLGLSMSARATASRLRSPPEHVDTSVCAAFERPVLASAESTLCACASLVRSDSFSRAANMSVSRTVEYS